MKKVPQKLLKARNECFPDESGAGFGRRVSDDSIIGKVFPSRFRDFRKVVCVEACRTPYGSFGGALRAFTAPELGALAIKELMRRTNGKLAPEALDYVIMGQVVSAGCGQIPSRQASILGELPPKVPSFTVNKVCSSGLKAIDMGVQLIQLGRAESVIAGGQESMSNAPYLLPDMRWGARMGLPDGQVVDAMMIDGLWDPFYNRHMAIHGSEAADEFGITRIDQDQWAWHSQQSAMQAAKEGKLDEEIFPVLVKKNQEWIVLDRDEGLKPLTTLEGLAGLLPVFNHKSPITGQPGSVTAGNAPGLSDGGDACLLMSDDMADALDMKPLFSIVDYAEISRPPKEIATVPGLAIKKVLAQNAMTIEQVDLFEINEAFAAVVLVSAKSILGMSNEEMFKKVNVNGSAIAFGHPIGASGARIAMTLAYELRRRGGGVGICALCSGLAQGDAMLIRVEK